jgi:hypothetical protein
MCECGCGQPTPLVTTTRRKRRHFRGHPVPYLRGHSPRGRAIGPDCPRWRGGRYLTSGGYVMVWCPGHPMAQRSGYAPEHRLVMSEKLGRLLLPTEHVHHRNGVKDDNRPENLEVYAGTAEHLAQHDRKTWTYSPETRARMAEAGRKGALARWGPKKH